MAITIRDVAKKAGVAPSTVSRVVADSPSISKKTKIKVRKVMEDLNYFPNANAQGLASSRSKTFGLVLPTASDAFYQNPFFPTVLRGINYAMSQNDYSILLSAGQTDKQRLNHIQKIVYGKQVEGLIFLYAAQNDPLLNFAQKAGCPSVVIGSPDNPKVHLVDNDNESLGEQATNYLIQEGCKHIAYIGGDMNQFFISDRMNGYKKALEENGLPFKEENLYNNLVFLPLDGYKMAKNTFDFEQYDGFVIADELVASGVQQALAEKNLSHIKTVTFKAFKHQLYNPGINESYINLNSHLLGSRAVNILFDSLDTEKENKNRFIHEYVNAELITTP